MKLLKIFLLLFVVLGFVACDDEKEGYTGEIPISRDAAYELVKKQVSDKPLNEIDIYVTPDMLPANTLVTTMSEEFTSPNCKSWLFFVDEMPMGNWSHPCKYIFVDASGKMVVHKGTMSPTYPSESEMERLNRADIWDEEVDYIIQDIPAVRSRAASANNLYAVVISGGWDTQRNYPRYWNDCSFIYKTLVNQYGYNPANIYVLMSDGTNPGVDLSDGTSSNVDLDGDGDADIDYSATKANVTNVFNQLANKLTTNDYLFIYTMDHGGLELSRNESFLALWNSERLYASEFANMVKSINAKATNIVMGQCNSGGFIDYLKSCPSVCISTACAKNENSYAMSNNMYDEYVYYWTNSHVNLSGDTDKNGFVTAAESHSVAKSKDTKNETPQHYAGADKLAERLALSGMIEQSYGDYIDGYCTINSIRYSFYPDEPDHEPEFGVHRGDKIDIYPTYPDISPYSFKLSLDEGGNFCFFQQHSNTAHLEINSGAPLGSRIRVKIEADIPASDYYICQYLNFFVH